MDNSSDVVFSQNSIEFVTVAAEFCAFIERAKDCNKADFVDKILKILPLLYVKVSLLPPCEPIGLDEPEVLVTEDDYEYIRRMIRQKMGAHDDYLEVFVPDMIYSEEPLTKNISEDLADIYQDVKDFIGVFRMGNQVTMHDALARCKEHFEEYWGQRLVNTMRALHDVKYNHHDADDEPLNKTDENEEIL
ncbi:MAG: DUF5063 domain-containing protein [Phocaeicola sp.]|nr:DUF5063 domain-containing protein [Phocaeicola sp.]